MASPESAGGGQSTHSDQQGQTRTGRLRDRLKAAAASQGSAAFVLFGGSPRGLRYLSADPTKRGIIAALLASAVFTVIAGARLTAQRAHRLLSVFRSEPD